MSQKVLIVPLLQIKLPCFVTLKQQVSASTCRFKLNYKDMGMVSVFVLIFLLLTLSENTSLLKFGNKVVGAMSLPPFLCLWYYFEQVYTY